MSTDPRCLCEYGTKQLLDENNIEVWFERYIDADNISNNLARLRVHGRSAFDYTMPIRYCPKCGVKIG